MIRITLAFLLTFSQFCSAQEFWSNEFDPTLFEEDSIFIVREFYNICRPEISKSLKNEILELSNYLKTLDSFKITISGHSDYRGSDTNNTLHTLGRALAVKKVLMESGIDSTLIIAKGLGEATPYIIDEQALNLGLEFEISDTLSEGYIKRLPPKEQEVANKINNRLEIKLE